MYMSNMYNKENTYIGKLWIGFKWKPKANREG